jgi:hypothetical protein
MSTWFQTCVRTTINLICSRKIQKKRNIPSGKQQPCWTLKCWSTAGARLACPQENSRRVVTLCQRPLEAWLSRVTLKETPNKFASRCVRQTSLDQNTRAGDFWSGTLLRILINSLPSDHWIPGFENSSPISGAKNTHSHIMLVFRSQPSSYLCL